MADKELVGEISHYYGQIDVAVIVLDKELKVGDQVHIHGKNTDFVQEVKSMQIDHETVEEGKAGKEVAIKIDVRVRKGDSVYKLTAEK